MANSICLSMDKSYTDPYMFVKRFGIVEDLTPIYAIMHNSPMNYREWLERQLDQLEMNPTSFARKYGKPHGVHQATLSRILGEKTTSPGYLLIRKIGGAIRDARRDRGLGEDEFKTDGPDHLLFSAYSHEQKIGAESNAEPAPKLLNTNLRVPVVGTAQLGDNGYGVEIEAPVGFGDGFVLYSTRDSEAYALRCRGDSMEPRIKDGEFVVVEPNYSPSPGDEVLVKTVDGRVMVKVFLYTRDDVVYLESTNKAHPNIKIPVSQLDKMQYVAAICKKPMWVPD